MENGDQQPKHQMEYKYSWECHETLIVENILNKSSNFYIFLIITFPRK